MVKIEKIQSSLFSNLYDSFLVDDDPLSSEQDWRNVFDYPWETEQDHCGFAMLDNDEVVGMLGMVFSERHVDGVQHKFCNLHTWWVREDHRGRSLALLRPLLRLNEYTITHFTPCDTVRAITKRLGFQDLSNQLRILLPNRLLWQNSVRSELLSTFDTVAIREKLNDWDRRLLDDHLPYGCGHLWVDDGDRSCYVIYTHVVRHRLPYCHIHYVSDRKAFASFENNIRSELLTRHKARFVAVDSRKIGDLQLPWSFNFWAPALALYKSSVLKPHQIDNLYSDVVFLKLSVLPDMSHEFKQLFRRISKRGGVAGQE